ncbi:MAG: alanine--tRNA ligase, partial [Gammaproteobacteria bacterium]
MTPRSSAEVRQAFLEFFGGCDHAIVPSGPLVPVGDSTLLFTNAGMVQFKDLFLGRDQRPYTRAASCQCCVRAGGKHNDLENVGYTARHHTFFEMLGNFSFGDYFKREAIRYAWDFLTEVLVLDPGRLWITVFREDDEAASIWLDEIKVDRNRFSRCTEKDNFWTMGPTGPCGPCSEIFYDHGPGIAGGPPGSRDEQGDRYIEIWNLVFTQYDRDEGGALHSIPRPSVDTGMGLERIAAVMQGVHSNYEIDVFRALIDAILVQLVQRKGLPRASLQAIADHIRASAFIAAEGVLPSNEGRGYVLRRIIRRALRHGHKLGIEGSFFHRLVAVLTQQMGEAYPHLQQAKARVEKVLKQEEERFFETLDQGLKLLERSIATLSGRVIPGRDVFQLYDTYGFPLDLTADIARERGLTLDLEGFEREMERQRARGRAASQFYSTGGSPQGLLPKLDRDAVNRIGPSEFTGYTGLRGKARVLALYREGEAVELLEGGVPGVAVLDRTPFYAESGGQIGDAGELRGPAGVFEVHDTQRQAGVHMHLGPVQSGSLHLGDRVDTVVDGVRRQSTALNHSATHLLHAALRRSLGEHVVQKGSLVAHDRLRFDFSHPGALGRSELLEVETMVNDEIRANRAVETEVMAYQ